MECKKCGNTEKFYTKDYIYGSSSSYYDGQGDWFEDGSNSAMYDSLKIVEGKVFYCNDCDKKVRNRNEQI